MENAICLRSQYSSTILKFKMKNRILNNMIVLSLTGGKMMSLE
jgi:hypothetical protein